MPSQSYIYQLLSGDRAIRVAELQPGQCDDVLTVTLGVTELPDVGNGWADPEYQTLSYEWGQSDRDRPIVCDGQTLLITQNLEAALQRLRLPDEPLRLWIDSICIDQENTRECNQQVSMMALIYKSSSRVNMWIGGENATTAEGILMLNDLQRLYDYLKKRLKSPDASRSWLEDDIVSTYALQKILGDDAGIENEKQERWDALDDILSRTYFERTWIAQEVLLSWNATVIIGSHRFPWHLLRNAALITQKCFCLPVNRESLSYWRLVALAQFDRRRWKGVPFTIPKLLQHLHPSRCHDPRDMVYGVLGMGQYPNGAASSSEPVDTAMPFPDYSKSVEQVYQETTAAIISRNQDLGIFFNIQLPSMRNLSSMPTWAIDWSPSPEDWWRADYSGDEAKKIKPLNAFQKNFFTRPVPHGIVPLFPPTDALPIRIAGSVLTVQGLPLGDVSWTSSPLHSDGLVSSLAKLHSAINDRCGNSLIEKYISGEPMIQALCKTILMGKNDLQARARGSNIVGPGGWNPMFESFFGVLVLDKMMQRKSEMPDVPQELWVPMCIKQTGAGLFMSAAREVCNERVFRTDGVGLMGAGPLDIRSGDKVILLRGAYAPVVVRRMKKVAGSDWSPYWEIVCEVYVHGAMFKEDKVYTDGLCGNWEKFMIR